MSNINCIEYKIWRFAYTSHVDTVYIPDNVKFYCFNKNRIEETRIKTSNENNPYVWDEDWVAVIPYSEDVENTIYSYKQSFNLNVYNINNQYIILHLHRIYPLCDNWCETDIKPDINPFYIRYRSTNIEYNKEECISILQKIEELNLCINDKNNEIKNTFLPVTKYVKINGFDDRGYLDITCVLLKYWMNNADALEIYRESREIQDVIDLGINAHEKLEYTTEEEFMSIFNDTLQKIINK